MTATDDRPVDVPPVAVEHPPWCPGHGCDVHPAAGHPALMIGTHVRTTEHMRVIHGTRLEVGVAAYGDEPQHITVMLSMPFRADEMLAPGMSEDETNQLTPADLRMLGETTLLEPEEARMLARFLVEAADERDRLAR